METLCSALKTALKKAAIDEYHFHDLRHCIRARKAGIQNHLIVTITGRTTLEKFERYDTVDEEHILKGSSVSNP